MADPSKAQIVRDEKAAAIQRLRADLLPGDTVYTILHSVSRSGMSRQISLYRVVNNEPDYITGYVANVTGFKRNAAGYLVVNGCGMDVGFEVVYNLGRALFPNGFTCAGEADKHRCHSNDHSNGDNDYTPHHHDDGGYALYQRWIG